MKILKIILLICLFFASPALATTYYVDPSGSNTSPYDTLVKAANQLETITEGYDLNGGDIIYVNGNQGSHSRPDMASSDSGSIIHSIEAVDVSGSIVTFSTTPSSVSTTTDYVYLYNSFRGNSGAFKVSSVSVANITVDTSDLPGESFVTEQDTDSPWTLKAVIIRPVVIIAYNTSSPPTLTGGNDGLHIGPGADCIFVSYINFSSQERFNWAITGDDSVASDYVCIDHCVCSDASHASTMIDGCEDGTSYESGAYSDGTDLYYTIVQHCDFSNAGIVANSTGELIYYGKDYTYQHGPSRGDDYVDNWYGQFMYNKLHDNYDYGDARSNPEPFDGKEDNRYTMIWGNYFYDNDAESTFGIIKMPGGESVIANNYFKDNNSIELEGIITAFSYTGMSSYTQYIFNNIFDSNKSSGGGNISIDGLNLGNMRIYNNTFYGVKNGDTAIHTEFWGSDSTIGYIYNNIFQHFATGVNKPSGSTISNDDNNFFYDNTANYTGWTPGGTVYTTDPGLTNPVNSDFTIGTSSNAKDAGTDLSAYFAVDNHDAANPTITTITQSVVRPIGVVWDIGVYEYEPPSGGDVGQIEIPGIGVIEPTITPGVGIIGP